MSENTFVIITGNKYPNGDAGAVRQHTFAKILKALGFQPLIIGMGETTNFYKVSYEDIDYYSLRYPKATIFFRGLGRVLFKNNLTKILNNNIKTIKGILLISGNLNTFKYVKKLCSDHHIPIYHDSVEWYSPSEFKDGARNKEYIHNNNINTRYIDIEYKVFVISTYLEAHFSSKGIRTIRVPVLMDIDNIDFCTKVDPGKRKIVYAGNMAGKDNIQPFISVLSRLKDDEKKKIQLDILGVTYEEYREKYGELDVVSLEETIRFHGRVLRTDVMEYLRNADFTILFRPASERYAKAGFPTKVVESLATATPVICNLTSDLGMYLVDGDNAIIVDNQLNCDPAVKRVFSLTEEKLVEMKSKSRETAEKYFDWRQYIDIFKKFIQE